MPEDQRPYANNEAGAAGRHVRAAAPPANWSGKTPPPFGWPWTVSVTHCDRSGAPERLRRLAVRVGAGAADVAQHVVAERHERATLAGPFVPAQHDVDDG
jgi:hypothetical protein